MNLLWRDGEMHELPAKCRLTIRRGDVFRHVLGGAGGWGDPAERDPARLAQDVAEGKLSAEYAHREYGSPGNQHSPRGCSTASDD
jgi:N-methylhydantoinase B